MGGSRAKCTGFARRDRQRSGSTGRNGNGFTRDAHGFTCCKRKGLSPPEMEGEGFSPANAEIEGRFNRLAMEGKGCSPAARR